MNKERDSRDPIKTDIQMVTHWKSSCCKADMVHITFGGGLSVEAMLTPKDNILYIASTGTMHDLYVLRKDELRAFGIDVQMPMDKLVWDGIARERREDGEIIPHRVANMSWSTTKDLEKYVGKNVVARVDENGYGMGTLTEIDGNTASVMRADESLFQTTLDHVYVMQPVCDIHKRERQRQLVRYEIPKRGARTYDELCKLFAEEMTREELNVALVALLKEGVIERDIDGYDHNYSRVK